MFIRRLGLDPHANGQMSRGLCGCPDILEMDNGDFAIIGEDITGQAVGHFALVRAAARTNGWCGFHVKRCCRQSKTFLTVGREIRRRAV